MRRWKRKVNILWLQVLFGYGLRDCGVCVYCAFGVAVNGKVTRFACVSLMRSGLFQAGTELSDVTVLNPKGVPSPNLHRRTPPGIKLATVAGLRVSSVGVIHYCSTTLTITLPAGRAHCLSSSAPKQLHVGPQQTLITARLPRFYNINLNRTACETIYAPVHGLHWSMNSLNILAHIGNTPPPSPPRSRAASQSNILHTQSEPEPTQRSNDAGAELTSASDETDNMVALREEDSTYADADALASTSDEKTPLFAGSTESPYADAKVSRAWLIPKRISGAVVEAVKILLTAVIVPGQYVIACFYDEDNRFSVLSPVYKISRTFRRKDRKGAATRSRRTTDASDINEKGRRKSRQLSVSQTRTKPMKRTSSVASSSAITSDSEAESERPPTRGEDNDTPSRHTRSKSNASSTTEEIAPAKRSIRIKLHNDDALRQRKTKKSVSRTSKDGTNQVSPEAAAALKSPTGPSTVSSKQLTRFPAAPQPPRPLVPRRQPSYSTSGTSAVGPHQKTLIIDLDETLIHSMAKGGRYTTGHMVEVKLQQPVNTQGQLIGPQVPILYYVHKRPHCDEFLKKVSQLPCRD